jgi:hypothetical protein
MPSLLSYYDISKNETSLINKVIHNVDDFKNYCIQLFNLINKKYVSSNTKNNTKLTYQQTDTDSVRACVFTINKEDTILRSGWIYNSSNTIITPLYEFKLMEINNEFTEYLNKQEETLNDLILLNNSLEKTIDYFFDKSPKSGSNKLNNKKLSFNFTEGLVEDTESDSNSNDDSESYQIDSIPVISVIPAIPQDYLNKTHTIHHQYQNSTNDDYLLPPINTENDESLESYMNNYTSFNYNSFNYSGLNYSNPVCHFYDNTKIYTLSQPQIYSPFIDKINYSLHGQCTTTTNNNNIISTPKNMESTRQGVSNSVRDWSCTKHDLSFIDELKEKLHQKFKNT